MQFEGGYRYPALRGPLAVAALVLTVAVAWGALALGRPLAVLGVVALALNLVGTAIVAAAFTPTGLEPPPEHPRGLGSQVRWLGAVVKWLAETQAGVPVKVDQAALYGGLALLAGGAVVGALVG